MFKKFHAVLTRDWIATRDGVDAVYAEERRRKKEREEQAAGSTDTQIARMRERLQNIEIEAEMKAKGVEPVLTESEKLFKVKEAFVEFYKHQWHSVLGIHSICAHAGKVRCTASFNGLDLMELSVDAAAASPPKGR
jgi:hypothetical protein